MYALFFQPAFLQTYGSNCGYSEVPVFNPDSHQKPMPCDVGWPCRDREDISGREYFVQAGRQVLQCPNCQHVCTGEENCEVLEAIYVQ